MTQFALGGDPSLIALPAQRPDVPWPTAEWPRATTADPADPAVDIGRLATLLDGAFRTPMPEPPELALTQAVVVVHRGSVIAERYGEPFVSDFDRAAGTIPDPVGPTTTFISWSMAKSMLHAAIGVCVGNGLIDVDEPAPVPEWSRAGDDPRRHITWDHLLHMSSGLEWNEDYVDAGVSDVIEMLFGDARDDMAAFAASRPLADPPGRTYCYSSGTSVVLARALERVLGTEGDATATTRFLDEALFEPIGMTTAKPRFDNAGTWVASSYMYASALDFARFGLLYLRGGSWDGRRVLPEGWIDTARTPTETDPEREHSAHWWVDRDDLGTFYADGYEGQRIRCVPALDLVVVRLGKTPAPDDPPPGEPAPRHPVDAWLDEVVSCFAD